MSDQKKKSIFKRWWFWTIIVFVIIGVAAASGGSGDDQPAAATNSQVTSQEPQASKEPEKPKNKPTISKDEFEQIKTGMTYEEIVKIVGSEGELLSEVGSPGDELHSAVYMWEGEGSLGANANVTFQGGKVIAKAQFGLK